MSDSPRTVANLFRSNYLTIGVRLTVCFLVIVILMIAADAVALWQVRQLAAHMQMLNAADRASSAIVRLHLDVNSFSGQVAALMRSHDARQFVTQAGSVRQTFLGHVQDAEQTLESSPEIAQDALFSSTLKTLKTTLPSQMDSEIELANAGDWSAIQLRLTGQIQDLIDLSSSLVQRVEERVFQARATVSEQSEQARHHLFIVLPVAWLLSLLAAAALGWLVTRTITIPLSELTVKAQALARGDFRHEMDAVGNDELAVLGKALNHAARQLDQQFELTLEARVAERTRIARELHDTLLQSFHGVLLGFQTAFDLLPQRPLDAKEKLQLSIDQAASAIIEGRDAVQGLRESVVQSNDLALAISSFGEELKTRSSDCPAFRVAVEGKPRNLHPIVRDEIFRIAAEALRNCFRHSQAREVEVEIRYDHEQFRLRVRDNGKGMDRAVLTAPASQKHFGLPGMRERAAIMGAKLTLWSEVDAGTELELCVPAANAYATALQS